jgi:hypothetical protein
MSSTSGRLVHRAARTLEDQIATGFKSRNAKLTIARVRGAES